MGASGKAVYWFEDRYPLRFPGVPWPEYETRVQNGASKSLPRTDGAYSSTWGPFFSTTLPLTFMPAGCAWPEIWERNVVGRAKVLPPLQMWCPEDISNIFFSKIPSWDTLVRCKSKHFKWYVNTQVGPPYPWMPKLYRRWPDTTGSWGGEMVNMTSKLEIPVSGDFSIPILMGSGSGPPTYSKVLLYILIADTIQLLLKP